VIARCHFTGQTPSLSMDLLRDALENLVVDTVIPLKPGSNGSD
jgi:hypothetical protein